MNWFVLLVFLGLLSASQCNSSERLIFAFATAPQTHFFFLKQQKLLPDVEQVKTSLEHLRVFANHGNFDAKVLIAQQYRDNPIRYQQT